MDDQEKHLRLKAFGNGNGVGSPTLNQTSVVTKKYVLDYTSALKNVIMEKETDGFDYRYVYGLEKLSVLISPVTTGAGGLVENGKVKLWYHHEHRLGSTDFLTDNIAGKVTSYIDYDEWGEPVKKAILKMGQRELDLVTEYTVHPYDAVLGVYYARARMLDTGDKRFMAVDPAKGNIGLPQTLTQYIYCLDNPTGYIDPFGLEQAKVTINNVTIRVDTEKSDEVLKMLQKFDASARKVNKNEIQVYNYEAKKPTNVKYGKDVLVADILKGAGFKYENDKTGPAWFYTEKCGVYIVGAKNKYEHHLNLSSKDIEDFFINLTLEDILMMGDLNNASAYDSAYAIIILKTYGEQGISILTDLNWSKDGAVLAELSYRVAQYGLSIRVIDQIEYEKFAAQRNALVSLAAAHLGYVAADRLLNGPNSILYGDNRFDDIERYGTTQKFRNQPYQAPGSAGSVDSFLEKNAPETYRTDVKSAFGTDAKVTTTTEDTTVYRYYGGSSGSSSYWVTPNQYTDPASKLALPSSNTAEYMQAYILPKGTQILEGSVAPQHQWSQPGGGYQYYIPDPSVLIPVK